MHVILFSLCYTFSARRFPLLATVGWTTFSFSCWFLSFVSPSYHDDSLREGFVVGFPCLSACVLLQFALLRLAPPPHRRYAPGFARAVCLIRVSAFPSIPFLRVFPGFIARPFRGVGVGFEDPHVRLMV